MNQFPAMEVPVIDEKLVRDAGWHHEIFLFRLPDPGISELIVCGVSLRQVVGILPAETFLPWPADPPRKLGVLSYGGADVPVLDLVACFGLGATDYRLARRLLLVRCARKGGAAAIPVLADFGQITAFEDYEPVSHRLPVHPSVLRGAYHFGPRLLFIPDLDALI